MPWTCDLDSYPSLCSRSQCVLDSSPAQGRVDVTKQLGNCSSWKSLPSINILINIFIKPGSILILFIQSLIYSFIHSISIYCAWSVPAPGIKWWGHSECPPIGFSLDVWSLARTPWPCFRYSLLYEGKALSPLLSRLSLNDLMKSWSFYLFPCS